MPRGGGRLLSAEHCDDNGNTAWNDGAGDPLTSGGDNVDRKPTNDTLLIDPSATLDSTWTSSRCVLTGGAVRVVGAWRNWFTRLVWALTSSIVPSLSPTMITPPSAFAKAVAA